MEKSSWTYLLLLGLSILYPLAQSFEKKVSMYRKFRFIFPGILFSATLFIIWDIFFTRYEIWGFNRAYTRDLYVAGIPVEEWLFFIVVPYCVFFIHEVLRYYVKEFYFPRLSKGIIIGLIAILTLSLPFVVTKTYTFTAFAFVLPFLVLQLVLKTFKTWFSGFILTYLITFIPFLVINGFLTRIPVIWYNDSENLALRITTVPLEDFVYLLGMLIPAFTIYQLLLQRYASPSLRNKMNLDKTTGF